MELSIRDSSTLAAHGPRLALAQGRSSKPDVRASTSSPGGPAASFKGGEVPQRAQYPLITEYSLNHSMKPFLILAIFLK